jgi:hypothetical protein
MKLSICIYYVNNFLNKENIQDFILHNYFI